MRQVWHRVVQSTLGRVGKNAAALLAAQVGARALNLVLVAQLARVLGAEGLGRYLLAMSVEAIALAISDLGLGTLALRELARREGGTGAAPTWGTMALLRGLAALLAVLVLDLGVAPLLFHGQRRALVVWASLALIPEAYNAMAIALIKARQRMEISSAISLGIRFGAAAAGAVLVALGYDERAPVIAYGAANLLGGGVFSLVLGRWGVSGRPSWSPARWGGILRESLPFALTGIAAMLRTRLDLLLLSLWRGDAAAGRYGAAYRLWETLGLIPASFLDALFPELARTGGAAGVQERFLALYRRGRRAAWVGVLALTAPCLLAAPWLAAALYGRSADSRATAALFRGLLLAFPFTYLYLLDGHALYALERQRLVTGAMILVVALNGALNALAIPRLGEWGACIAALVSEAGLFALLRMGLHRTLRSSSRLPLEAG